MHMTLSLGSISYTVSQNGLGSYYLTGPRGARYELARRPKQPEIMYAIQLGGKWPKVSPIFKGHRFTDKDGELRMFRTW